MFWQQVGCVFHVIRGAFRVEPFRRIFGKDCRRKWTKGFSKLDFQVQHGLHILYAWIAQNRARPKCAGAKLHSPTNPSDDLAFGQQTGSRLVDRTADRQPVSGRLQGRVARLAAEIEAVRVDFTAAAAV